MQAPNDLTLIFNRIKDSATLELAEFLCIKVTFKIRSTRLISPKLALIRFLERLVEFHQPPPSKEGPRSSRRHNNNILSGSEMTCSRLKMMIIIINLKSRQSIIKITQLLSYSRSSTNKYTLNQIYTSQKITSTETTTELVVWEVPRGPSQA